MKRSILSLLVDLAAFVGLLLLISSGFLIRYALPPGSGDIHGFGGGARAAERTITLVWGLTRHEWGEIHFWIAVMLMAILALHLLLHWRWIVSMMRGQPSTNQAWRIALGLVGLVSLIAVAVLPFLSPKQQIGRSDLEEQRGGQIIVPHTR